MLFPSNNFAESPEFPRNLSQENPVKISTAILRNFLEPIPRNQVRGISWNPFQGFSHNSIQGISCNQLQEISCCQFCRQSLWKFLGISIKKFFKTNSWEFPGNYSQDFLKSSSGISWNILSIFLCKFTDQDLGPIVVNNLITLLPLQLFRSITIFSVRML